MEQVIRILTDWQRRHASGFVPQPGSLVTPVEYGALRHARGHPFIVLSTGLLHFKHLTAPPQPAIFTAHLHDGMVQTHWFETAQFEPWTREIAAIQAPSPTGPQ